MCNMEVHKLRRACNVVVEKKILNSNIANTLKPNQPNLLQFRLFNNINVYVKIEQVNFSEADAAPS